MDAKILTPIDNTDIGFNINQTFEKGYSEYNRLYIPNQGEDDNGDMYHYFPYGVIAIDDKIVVDKSHLFLKNGYLLKEGVIVEKYYVTKNSDGIILGDEQYFKVIDSNVDTIPKGSLIVAMADQSYRFNLDTSEFFFVQADKVLIVMSVNGLEPGPYNMLLEKKAKCDILGLEENLETNKGDCDNKTYFFEYALYDITIANKPHVIVAKKNIKLVTQDQYPS